VRNFNKRKSVILGLFIALLLGTAFLIIKPSPEEINAKECKRPVDSALDRIAIKAPLLRDESVLSCTNEMNRNLRSGLPSFASHSSRDMQSYWEKKSKEELIVRREKFKTELKEIAASCAESSFTIYTSMYTRKSDGESKEAQLMRLQAGIEATNPSSILEAIQINLAYKALDDIYAKTGPTSSDVAVAQIAALHKQCKEIYEQAMLLR